MTEESETQAESMTRNVAVSRRELMLVLAAWTGFMAWVLGYSALYGYERAIGAGAPPLVLGMPHWVFWGILTPWMTATVFTVWFCLRALRNS